MSTRPTSLSISTEALTAVPDIVVAVLPIIAMSSAEKDEETISNASSVDLGVFSSMVTACPFAVKFFPA